MARFLFLFFCIFHALSFELNIFFDRRFPLNRDDILIILVSGFSILSHRNKYLLMKIFLLK